MKHLSMELRTCLKNKKELNKHFISMLLYFLGFLGAFATQFFGFEALYIQNESLGERYDEGCLAFIIRNLENEEDSRLFVGKRKQEVSLERLVILILMLKVKKVKNLFVSQSDAFCFLYCSVFQSL